MILLSPPVVGKAQRAIRLAIGAAQHGRRVYYGTLADLINLLEEAQAAGRRIHRLRTLTHPPLLVVDEIGYLPISHTGAMFQAPLATPGCPSVLRLVTTPPGVGHLRSSLTRNAVNTRSSTPSFPHRFIREY